MHIIAQTADASRPDYCPTARRSARRSGSPASRIFACAAATSYSSRRKRTVHFRRLPYDIAAAQAKIRKAGLPERLAERLAIGQ